MYVSTGRMNRHARKNHHDGWLRLFRGKHMKELWVGDRWIAFGR